MARIKRHSKKRLMTALAFMEQTYGTTTCGTTTCDARQELDDAIRELMKLRKIERLYARMVGISVNQRGEG